MSLIKNLVIVAVIPCYNSFAHAPLVVRETLKYVDKVICVDDNCQFGTSDEIKRRIDHPNLLIIKHKRNKGVGGAVKTGLRLALDMKADIIIKIDSDGQMPPEAIPELIQPIREGKAQITKGNRFKDTSVILKMPRIRFFGNFFLSFLTKLSTGYWELFDPTNGFIAIKADVVKLINLDKIDNRYFFETDLLFRSSLNEFVIKEIYMDAKYGEENSNLKPLVEVSNFFFKHFIIFSKRIFYHYFLLDFNPGSISLLISILFFISGLTIGGINHIYNFSRGLETPLGIQVLFLLFIVISIQFLINFLYYDVTQKPLFRKLKSI